MVISAKFKKYINKEILAIMDYNENFYNPHNPYSKNARCYIRPRAFINKDGTCESINLEMLHEDFPKYGAIEVMLTGDESAEELYKRCGHIVQIKINSEPEYFENTTSETRNEYRLKFNEHLRKGISDIWISSFSGKGFYQVIDVYEDIDTLKEKPQITLPYNAIITTQILLRNAEEGQIYGPFAYDTIDTKLVLSPIDEYQYLIGDYDAESLDDKFCIIYDQNEEEEEAILLPTTELQKPKDCEKYYDWITDQKLTDTYFSALKDNNVLSREQVNTLQDTLPSIIRHSDILNFNKLRSDRIKGMLRSIYKESAFLEDIAQYIVSDTEMSDAIVSNIVENNFYLIEDKLTSYTTVKENIRELKAEEERLKDNIQQLKTQGNELSAESLDAYTKQIDSLNKQLIDLKAKNNDTFFSDLQETVEQLKRDEAYYRKKRDEAKDDYMKQIFENSEIENQLNAKLDEFGTQAKLIAKSVDNKLLDRVLQSVSGDTKPTEVIPFNEDLLHEPMDAKEIGQRVFSCVRDKAHRNVEFNDIVNYLTCITQGFITTFAGEPGTGKTSLCSLLARSLGLATGNSATRYVEIPVERGWNSHKDFIGYYNPLSNKMEKSNVEVFDSFRRLNEEYHADPYDPAKIAPFLMLLDEANLSPIEHYWSAFLKLCDMSSTGSRNLILGGDKQFMLPKYLRFLATVNFDHTTEELSPRFIDRSWIILLEPTRIDEAFYEDEFKNMDDMVSYSSLTEAFSIHPDDKIPEAIQDKWNTIQAIFRSEKCGMSIAPRNLKMIRNYCAVACRIMECNKPSTRLAPLDYAFSQKILPGINGSGDDYKFLFDQLMKECTEQNMPLTAHHLARMQRSADHNMGYYQFFAR